ncbi:hypothetical protein QCA50_000688 [Cerrena zonata]|uniref:Alanyl-tRNA synthetase class IIc N-terminal domain-containing protein n=1 Tax=Cerrena zonata TaxID=2478898 RepID=A0AAW0GV88_9APHY
MAASAIVLPPPATPASYHRIISPTLSLPTDTSKPIPVGLLACQRDPLLRELVSTVITATLAQAPPTTTTNRKNKKDKASEARDTLLEVILHDTVLFPEGGGQPNDIGIITSADGELWDVVDVKRRGGHAIHFVKVKEGKTADDALTAFATGSIARTALGDQGFQRRLDHMSMHTAQHLLSAVLETKLDLPTLSWALTSYPTPSYVEVPRAMTAEEIALIQEEANKLVFEGRQVHVEVEELDSSNRAYDTPSVGIPSDYTGGVKRTVIIDGVDRNPCCGTHLPTIHNLQLFLIPHTEGLSRANTTSARLYFLSGPRLITYLTSTHSYLTATSAILSCGPAQVAERIEQVIEERKKATKRIEAMEPELAGFVAKELLKVARDGKPLVAVRHQIEDSSNPLGFLSAISTAFIKVYEDSSNKCRVPSYNIAITSSPTTQTSTSTTTILLFSSDEKELKVYADAVKKTLGLKGGGKGTKWSGKFMGVWTEHREGLLLKETLESVRIQCNGPDEV